MKYGWIDVNNVYVITDETGKAVCRCDNYGNVRYILVALECFQKAVGDYPVIKNNNENSGMITIPRWQWMLLQNKSSRMDSITRTCKEVLQVELSSKIG